MLFWVLICTTLSAQVAKLDDIRAIKNSKVIVGLSGNDELDEILRRVITKYWSFSEVIAFENAETATKKAKLDDNLMVLKLGKKVGYSPSHSTPGSNNKYKYITEGHQIEIGTGKNKLLVSVLIPTFKDDEITEEILVYGISTLQHLCKTMDDNNLKSNMKIKDVYKENTPQLKNKTLYIPEFWLSPKFDINEIKNLYDAKIKVVSYEDWRNAILTGEEGIAYVMVVPTPSGGNYVYLHYLVDAHTSNVYAFVYPKVSGSIAGINVTKSNTGFINDKNIKMYNEALNGKW